MLSLRPLTNAERERVFATAKPTYDREAYIDTIREMEGGIAYAVTLNGSSARAERVRLGRAAKQLGLKVRYASVPKDAREIYVELV